MSETDFHISALTFQAEWIALSRGTAGVSPQRQKGLSLVPMAYFDCLEQYKGLSVITTCEQQTLSAEQHEHIAEVKLWASYGNQIEDTGHQGDFHGCSFLKARHVTSGVYVSMRAHFAVH